MGANDKHKYLGRSFTGNTHRRGEEDLEYRIQCAWAKFHQFNHILTDKATPTTLRLKLFQSLISPTILYSLETCAFSMKMEERLDIIQRKMLRKIIGWPYYYTTNSWEEAGHQMKLRMKRCLQHYPIQDWSRAVHERKQRIYDNFLELPFWTQMALSWDPRESHHNLFKAFRRAGRPSKRWDDPL